MAKVSEQELLALKAKYLAAYSKYESRIRAVSQSGLQSASSLPDRVFADLTTALTDLQAARMEYRAALFKVAFGPDTAVN